MTNYIEPTPNMTPAQTKKFVDSNIGLLAHIAKSYQYRSPSYTFDDCLSSAKVGLLIAADKWNTEIAHDSGASFGKTFAPIWIHATLRREIDNCGHAIRLPIDQVGKIDHTAVSSSDIEIGEGGTIGDLFGSDDSDLLELEVSDHMKYIFSKMTPLEKTIATGIYLQERTLADIADELGCSKQYVSQVHAKTLARLSTDDSIVRD